MEPHSRVIYTCARMLTGRDFEETSLADRRTGVAFQAVTATQSGAAEGSLNLIKDWGLRSGVSDKVPSAISYTPSTDDYRQWGADLSPGSLTMVWTKLELEQQSRSDELSMILGALKGSNNLDYRTIKEAQGLPSYPAKDPVVIVADYLTKVREHLWGQLLSVYGEALLANIIIDLVVSVPAVCPYIYTIENTTHTTSRYGQKPRGVEHSVQSAKLASISIISLSSVTSS